jgi:hypothetical protein
MHSISTTDLLTSPSGLPRFGDDHCICGEIPEEESLVLPVVRLGFGRLLGSGVGDEAIGAICKLISSDAPVQVRTDQWPSGQRYSLKWPPRVPGENPRQSRESRQKLIEIYASRALKFALKSIASVPQISQISDAMFSNHHQNQN